MLLRWRLCVWFLGLRVCWRTLYYSTQQDAPRFLWMQLTGDKLPSGRVCRCARAGACRCGGPVHICSSHVPVGGLGRGMREWLIRVGGL